MSLTLVSSLVSPRTPCWVGWSTSTSSGGSLRRGSPLPGADFVLQGVKTQSAVFALSFQYGHA